MRGSFWFTRRTEQRFRQFAITAVKSLKIKLLLCCCISLTVLAFTSSASSFLAWTNERSTLHHSSVSGKGYSIVMNTWKRYDLLKQSIKHYALCPRLESVHIVWSEPSPPSDSLIKYLHRVIQSKSKNGRHVKLKFDINKEDSLNNRFKEIKNLETDAVFSIDDDVLFPCSSVEFAFDVWQSAPDTMVGFVPRSHWVVSSKRSGEKFRYGGWWSVWWTGTYSMVLSKAAFFHKKYFSHYTNEMPRSIREYVTKNRNCEDIAMSILVANATGAPPIWVKDAIRHFGTISEALPLTSLYLSDVRQSIHPPFFLGCWQSLNFSGNIYEIGSTGISSLGSHSDRRTECLNRFAAEYGRMPLVSTTLKAVDSRNTWFW